MYRSLVVTRICINKFDVKSIRGLSTSRVLDRNDSFKTSEVKPYKSISDTYSGKSVFITGGTGFLGKILIERLLYNCADIGNIYVLIRGKKGVDTDHRLQQMMDVPIFNKLKTFKPDALKKVVPIEGDMTATELAIKTSDQQKLIDNVSYVFHSAATVKFTDTLKDIIQINYEGTKKVIDLSKKMKSLETFVYISTAFANGDKLIIDEVVYPTVRDEKEVHSFIDNYGESPKGIDDLLCGLLNKYTLSKTLCERYVDENSKEVKSIIVRPSIVTPVLQDPLPGWLDSWVGATAIFSDVGRGLTRVMYGHDNVPCDLIPVDYVCNLTIAAAARGNETGKAIVYNSCSSSLNPISWKRGADLFVEEAISQGKYEMYPTKVAVTYSPVVAKFLTFALATTPAFVADLWLRVTGKTPRYVKMNERSRFLRDLLRRFTSTPYLMKTDNALALMESLDERDKVLFPCDPRMIIWKQYIPVMYRGVQKYLNPTK